MNHLLILASKSPRRQQLLTQLGYEFNTESADIDESVLNGEAPAAYVERLAVEKARVIATQNKSAHVLGSDTSVIVDGQILGKPADYADFRRMMKSLSDKAHQVLTGIALVTHRNGKVEVDSCVVSTDVHFKAITENEIRNYWVSGEPEDKAGGYGIQGLGAQFVEKIHGCYFSVVGLPLFETAKLLAQRGLLTSIQKNTSKHEES